MYIAAGRLLGTKKDAGALDTGVSLLEVRA
jgi:hypothetical protein